MPGKTLLTEEQETQNLARAARAYVALEAYRNFKKEGPEEPHFRDLLSDMMHYADANDFSFADELSTAQMNFGAEMRGED